MKQFIIIFALCVSFPSVTFAASIEQQKLFGSDQSDLEVQQQQQQKKILIVPFDTNLAAAKEKAENNKKEDQQYMVIPTPLYNYLLKSGQIKEKEQSE
jgi:hypothetical protein